MIKKTFLSLILIVTTAYFINAQERHQPGKGYERGNGHYSHGNGNGYGHTGKSGGSATHGVAAPLDGGLLVVLGAAGVAYYVSRKKKDNL
jgi:hypothetical protein